MTKATSAYLRRIREEAGLSQGDVSRAFGFTSPQFISNMERNICYPPGSMLPKLAALYKMDKDELIKNYIELRMVDFRNQLLKAVAKPRKAKK